MYRKFQASLLSRWVPWTLFPDYLLFLQFRQRLKNHIDGIGEITKNAVHKVLGLGMF